MAKPTALQMRFPPLIVPAVLGLALAPLSAMAATVISVGDGDTLRVEDDGAKLTIRVACIDAPEMAQAPYGQEARKALQELLPVGTTVALKAHTKDRYGRTVAEVFAQNGENVGLSLVQQGHAFVYRQYLKQCEGWAYLDREQLAQRYRVGVWKFDGGIERPWDWRAANRGAPRLPTQQPVTLTIINDPKPAAQPSPAAISGQRWRCREVGSWQRAQELLREGHTYLDGDSDGEACEALR